MDLESGGNLTVKELFELLKMLADEEERKYMAYNQQSQDSSRLSVDTLYRKERNFRKLGLDGLLDKRGKGRKGKSKISEEMWQTFLCYYLDEAQHPIQKCYEYTRLYFQETAPELVADIPTYSTFWRRVQNDIPEPMEVLGRQGQKAFYDKRFSAAEVCQLI